MAEAAPARTPAPMPTAPSPAPEAAPTSQPTPQPAPVAGTALDRWAADQLQIAFAQIERGEYDRARATLDGVREKATDSVLAREAARGSVALYNHKRIRSSNDVAQQDLYRTRAARDLGDSMWSRLFS